MSLLLGLCVCTLGFTACGGDDDDDTTQPNTPEVPNNGGDDDDWESDANDPVTADEVKGIGRELLKVTTVGSNGSEMVTEFTYADGKVASMTTHSASESLEWIFIYSDNEIIVKTPGGTMEYVETVYKLENGRIVESQFNSFIRSTYTYNVNNRLVSVNKEPRPGTYSIKTGSEERWVWKNGNIQKVRSVTLSGEDTTTTDVAYGYNNHKVGKYALAMSDPLVSMTLSMFESSSNVLYLEGFFGRQSINFVSNCGVAGQEYDYEFNSDGSPSKMYLKYQRGIPYYTSTFEWGNFIK